MATGVVHLIPDRRVSKALWNLDPDVINRDMSGTESRCKCKRSCLLKFSRGDLLKFRVDILKTPSEAAALQHVVAMLQRRTSDAVSSVVYTLGGYELCPAYFACALGISLAKLYAAKGVFSSGVEVTPSAARKYFTKARKNELCVAFWKV